MKYLLIILFFICTFLWCEQTNLILYNGKLVTMDIKNPVAEALIIHGDRITKVGNNKEILSFADAFTRKIDLKGKLAIPGFIESHGHFMSLGYGKMNLDLTQAANWHEIVLLVKKAVAQRQPGQWILGRGWHQEKWDKTPSPNISGLPVHKTLSEVSPNNPVLLNHASGHAIFANALAMKLANITKDTASPPGGEIVKDDKGNPSGAFRETAASLIYRAKSYNRTRRTIKKIKEETLQAVKLASDECLSKGITSFQDAGSSFATIAMLRELESQKLLRIRLWIMANSSNQELSFQLRKGIIKSKYITVRAIKRSIDGALGSHGAWLLNPYTDMPKSKGLNTTSVRYLEQTAKLAIKHGFQLCIHAIGDRANHEVLDLYMRTFARYPKKQDLRWRIEHAQHLAIDDIPRFGQLGVIASMQGIHCTSDGPWVSTRLGEKRAKEGAYVWQKLLQTGALICNGTDAPVENVDPIACFYASVSRKLKDGSRFFKDQKMTRMQALKSYTIDAAYAAFEEREKGSLTPGKLADITVLSHDIVTIPEKQILQAKVCYTLVGGKIVYRLP